MGGQKVWSIRVDAWAPDSFWIWGLGFKGFGFRVYSSRYLGLCKIALRAALGLRLQGWRVRVSGFGFFGAFRASGVSGFRVSGCRVYLVP